MGKKLGEAIEGFRFGCHTKPSVDDPKGGADIIVAQGFLDGFDVAGEYLRRGLFGSLGGRRR